MSEEYDLDDMMLSYKPTKFKTKGTKPYTAGGERHLEFQMIKTKRNGQGTDMTSNEAQHYLDWIKENIQDNAPNSEFYVQLETPTGWITISKKNGEWDVDDIEEYLKGRVELVEALSKISKIKVVVSQRQENILDILNNL